MKSERVYTAYHESAHAIAAYALGMPVTKLWIAADGRQGACEYLPKNWLCDMIVSMAGAFGAGCVPNGHTMPDVLPVAHRGKPLKDDTENARDGAVRSGSRTTAVILLHAEHNCARLIWDRRNALDELARMLERRLSIAGEDVMATLSTLVTPYELDASPEAIGRAFDRLDTLRKADKSKLGHFEQVALSLCCNE